MASITNVLSFIDHYPTRISSPTPLKTIIEEKYSADVIVLPGEGIICANHDSVYIITVNVFD